MMGIVQVVVPVMAWLVVRGLGCTLRYRLAGWRPFAALIADGSPIVAAMLHGRLFLMADFFSQPERRPWTLMVSRSRDGDLLHRVFSALGYRTARGSSGRGGSSALMQLTRGIRSGQEPRASIAVDGSRGPIYQAKPGVLTLASKTDAWLICAVATVDRAWIVPRAWDRTRIAQPWAQVSMVFSRPIRLPPNLTPAAVSRLQPRLQQLFDAQRRWLDRRVGRCRS